VIAVVPAAQAATDPTVTFSGGAIRVEGTAAADAFTVLAGDATHVVIDAATAFASADDGVCATLGTEATCELDFDETAPRAPADVVFDLSGAGADSVDASGRGPGVRSVTVTYAGAPTAVTYVGGAPAHATVGGESDTLTGVDRVVGTPYADTFTGGPAAETLAGGDGDDTFDVARAGGQADSVDCGAGKDALSYRSGLDVQSSCEILNGADTTAPPPAFSGPPIGPAPPPAFLPAPTFRMPAKVTGGTIDVAVRCAADCAGTTVTVLPPPLGPASLPLGWPAGIPGGSLPTLLSMLSATLDPAKLDQELRATLGDLQAALDAANAHAQSALEQALLQQQRAQAEAMLLIAQAMIASAGTTQGKAMNKLATDAGKADDKLKTPMNGVKLSSGTSGSAAAAKRPTVRTLSRWLLVRTARALPTVHPKVTKTAIPGVYRARIAAPVWLRASSRMLRHRGAKTLPVRFMLGTTTTATLRLPLPR
jgi:hypothetical protein